MASIINFISFGITWNLINSIIGTRLLETTIHGHLVAIQEVSAHCLITQTTDVTFTICVDDSAQGGGFRSAKSAAKHVAASKGIDSLITKKEWIEPQMGSLAMTARIMATCGFMSGDEADRWKDARKDAAMGL